MRKESGHIASTASAWALPGERGVNFLMDEGEERARAAYGTEKYDRLKALKRQYDPDNVFRLNQNIPPG